MTTAVSDKLMTIEEYDRLPDLGHPTELIRGRIVHLNFPMPRHGYVCGKIIHVLIDYLDEHDVGRAMCNDTGVITQRDPDSLRGADVLFYSYSRMARGPVPMRRSAVVPELIFEVLSPDDRASRVLEKVAEYLNAGVLAVCLVDPDRQWVHVYSPDNPDQPELNLSGKQELQFPDILPGFSVAVERFFA